MYVHLLYPNVLGPLPLLTYKADFMSNSLLQYSFLKVKLYMEIHFWYSSVLNLTHANIWQKKKLWSISCLYLNVQTKLFLPVYSEDRYKLYYAYILYAVFVWKKKNLSITLYSFSEKFIFVYQTTSTHC